MFDDNTVKRPLQTATTEVTTKPCKVLASAVPMSADLVNTPSLLAGVLQITEGTASPLVG